MTTEYPDSLCVTRQRKGAAYPPRPNLEGGYPFVAGFFVI